MELLQKEENIQLLTTILTPMITQAVNDAIPPELMQLTGELRQARDDLAAARQEIERVKASFIVGEDARKMGETIDTVKATAIAHEQELATLKATHETRFDLVEKQITTIRRDIDQGVKSVARSSRTMGRTVAKWLKESAKKEQDALEREKKRQTEIDREIQAIKDAHEEDNRRNEERLRAESLVVRDIDSRVQLSIERQNVAMFGDVNKKIPGLVEDMRAVKTSMSIPSFIFGTWVGRTMVLPAVYGMTIFLIQHPEFFNQVLQSLR